jgi:hypothetical protein
MSKPVRLAVLGAALMGKSHLQHIKSAPEAELLAIVDPSPEAKSMALEMNVRDRVGTGQMRGRAEFRFGDRVGPAKKPNHPRGVQPSDLSRMA